MTSDRLDDWHRLFGLTLMDVFSDTPWRVELEKDLAIQRQLLDIVIIEQTTPDAAAVVELPDGLESLRAHNLLTYKSKQEPLDGWALHELVGHYVNYRKLLSPNERLLPEADFQLYAVATRHPRGLAGELSLQPTAWPGGHDVPWGTATIRLIVLSAIAEHPRNALGTVRHAAGSDSTWRCTLSAASSRDLGIAPPFISLPHSRGSKHGLYDARLDS